MRSYHQLARGFTCLYVFRQLVLYSSGSPTVSAASNWPRETPPEVGGEDSRQKTICSIESHLNTILPLRSVFISIQVLDTQFMLRIASIASPRFLRTTTTRFVSLSYATTTAPFSQHRHHQASNMSGMTPILAKEACPRKNPS